MNNQPSSGTGQGRRDEGKTTRRGSDRRQPNDSERVGAGTGSYPVRADASARRQALSDRLQGDVGLVNDLIQAAQGKAVDHLFAAALGVDETAVPQAGQMRADPGLRLAHRAHQLTNGAFMLLEQLQYVEPGRIS